MIVSYLLEDRVGNHIVRALWLASTASLALESICEVLEFATRAVPVLLIDGKRRPHLPVDHAETMTVAWPRTRCESLVQLCTPSLNTTQTFCEGEMALEGFTHPTVPTTLTLRLLLSAHDADMSSNMQPCPLEQRSSRYTQSDLR